MSTAPVLVLGATGKTGRRIVQRLTERGQAVRAASRRSDPPFDWDDPSAWPDVLRGVRAVHVSYYPDLAVPAAPAAMEELTRQALAAGVERIVLLSGRGEANARRCEDIVLRSGIDATVVRCSWFAQNFDEGHLLEPVLAGSIALPAGDVREPFVDTDDVADVATAALTEAGHAGQLYELTGPRLLSFADAAGEIASAAGREVRYLPISNDDYRAFLSEHADPELANLLADLCNEVLDGRNASLGDGVQRALGREPRDFSDYCQAVAATGVWGSAE